MQARMISDGKYLFCLVVTAIVNGISISSSTELPVWDKPYVEVKEGDHLSISCKVFGLGNIDVIRIVYLINNQKVTITDNSNVKLPFRNLPRYKIHYELDENVGIVHLHYRGIKGSDAGTLGCYKLSDESTIAFLEIKVLVPVEKFYIIYVLEDENEKSINNEASEIVADDGDTVTVGCVAVINSDLVDPQLDIAIDDKSRTADAVLKKNRTSVASDDDLIVYKSKIKLSLVFAKVNHTYSRRIIKCTAKVKGFEDKTETAVLKILYAPVITCSETAYKRHVRTRLTFTCNVHSNPNVIITWQKRNQELENVTVKEKVLDEESVQVNLTIAELKASDFATYTLTATNEIGITTKMIIVEEDLGFENQVNVPSIEEIPVDDQSDLDFSNREDFENKDSDDDVIVNEAIHGLEQSYNTVSGSSIAVHPVFVVFVFGFSISAKWLHIFI